MEATLLSMQPLALASVAMQLQNVMLSEMVARPIIRVCKTIHPALTAMMPMSPDLGLYHSALHGQHGPASACMGRMAEAPAIAVGCRESSPYAQLVGYENARLSAAGAAISRDCVAELCPD